MKEDDIDLERIVYDPKYRRDVMKRLNGERSETPRPPISGGALTSEEPDAAE